MKKKKKKIHVQQILTHYMVYFAFNQVEVYGHAFRKIEWLVHHLLYYFIIYIKSYL